MTGLALKHLVENSFSEAEGARPASRNIPRIGLVFTDGRSQDDITEYAKKAKEAGKTLLQRWGLESHDLAQVERRLETYLTDTDERLDFDLGFRLILVTVSAKRT